jgi:O-antigen ligase
MTEEKYNVMLSRLTFVMCSSFLMIRGVNLSFFFYVPLLVATLLTRSDAFFALNSRMKTWALCFVLGATASMLNNLWSGNGRLFDNSLAVYPNYLYWGFLLWQFTTFATFLTLDYRRLFNAITLAVLFAGVYYWFAQDHFADKMFLKKFGKNSFSFVLICFVPYCVYSLRTYSRLVALSFLAVILLHQLVDGRRAGFLLTLSGGILAYFVDSLRLRHANRLAVITVLMGLMLQLKPVENAIGARSERIQSLMYGGVTSLSEDRSHLVRLAMLEKGIRLFRDNVFFGIGLNNFKSVEAEMQGNFEGSEFVIHKGIDMEISSHNSYINILAEGGLVLTIPFMLIFGTLLFEGAYRFRQLYNYERVIMISFSLMCAHLLLYNGIVNSLAWFNAALLSYVVVRQRLYVGVRRPKTPPSLLGEVLPPQLLGSGRDG